MSFSIAFVPNLAGAKSDGVALADIPQEVRDAVEEMYKAGKANPNGKFRMTFPNKAELLATQALMTAYCAQRLDEQGQPSPLRIRKSPSRKLPETQGDFRVMDIPVEAEAATDAIVAGVEAVKEAAAAAAGPVTITMPDAPAAPVKASGRKR